MKCSLQNDATTTLCTHCLTGDADNNELHLPVNALFNKIASDNLSSKLSALTSRLCELQLFSHTHVTVSQIYYFNNPICTNICSTKCFTKKNYIVLLKYKIVIFYYVCAINKTFYIFIMYIELWATLFHNSWNGRHTKKTWYRTRNIFLKKYLSLDLSLHDKSQWIFYKHSGKIQLVLDWLIGIIMM